MDKPEPVRRVTPPSTTIANTNAQQISNQVAIARLDAALSSAVFIGAILAAREESSVRDILE